MTLTAIVPSHVRWGGEGVIFGGRDSHARADGARRSVRAWRDIGTIFGSASSPAPHGVGTGLIGSGDLEGAVQKRGSLLGREQVPSQCGRFADRAAPQAVTTPGAKALSTRSRSAS